MITISEIVTTTTITDVARHAGVSAATVSRFLQGQRVRAAGEIRDAIELLGFTPSAAARSLKSGVTMAIGVVVPDIANPFFAAVVKGAESVSRDDGYQLFLCNTEESIERERVVLRTLAARVDGFILAPAREPVALPDAVANVPIVFLDREVYGAAFDSVLVDNVGGARGAIEYLLELGHRRIGVISGSLDSTPGRFRFEGVQAALEAHGVALEPGCAQFGDFRQESGYQATLRLLALKVPPTAIFVANNLMSLGALRALHDMHVRIPADMSFIGFDDVEFSELLTPPLTVVDRPMEDQGALAMRLLLRRLGHASGTLPRRIVLDTRLVRRGSCGPPPTPARKEQT